MPHKLNAYTVLVFLLAALVATVLCFAPVPAKAALPDICGYDGGPACPGGDSDLDGFADSVDCDDTDPLIYPTVDSVRGTLGCAANEWKICQANGSWGACTSVVPDEATGSGSSYYIEKGQSNANNCTSESTECGNFGPFGTYDGTGDPQPGNYFGIDPGDVVYLKDSGGDYTDSDLIDWESGDTYFMYAEGSGASGTAANPFTIKNYPGHRPKIKITNGGCYRGQYIGHHYLKGLECEHDNSTGGEMGTGMFCYSTNSTHGCDFERLKVHGVDGSSSNNNSCVQFHGDPTTLDAKGRVHHSILYDCYDREDISDSNNYLMVIFRGQVEVDHSIFYTTVASPGGLKQKHSNSTSTLHAHHNRFHNMEGAGVGVHAVTASGKDVTIERNIMVDVDGAFAIRDNGGDTFHQGDQIIRYNTVKGGKGLSYNPVSANDYPATPIGTLQYHNNIIYDDQVDYAGDRAITTIARFGYDTVAVADANNESGPYDDIVVGGKLDQHDNCYYNPNTSDATFDLFGKDEADKRKGKRYTTLATYQAVDTTETTQTGIFHNKPAYELNSDFIDPSFDSALSPGQVKCQNKGVFAGLGAPASTGHKYGHAKARRLNRRGG